MSDVHLGLSRASQYRVYGLFLLSGASGLMYQIVWVRQFSYVFGNSVHSAAIVTALFMAGLGLGGWAAGGYVDSRFQANKTLPLQGYGWLEAAIGVCGLLTAALLPMLGPLSAAASSYVELPNGWYALSFGSNLLRYLVPIVLLTPVTAMMGATLTLLIRFIVWTEVEHAGLRIGLLYGFNTAGAALGCLATDMFLIPGLGLLLTQLLASLGNFAAAVGAFRLARELSGRGAQSPAPEERPGARFEPAEQAPPQSRILWGACLAVMLSGAVGMGMEIVWFRYLISMLGGFREVFSLLLGIILVGIWAGSTLAGLLHRRFGGAVMLYAVAQTVLIVASGVPLMLLTRTGLLNWIGSAWSVFKSSPAVLHSLLETTVVNLIPIIAVTGLPAVAMGMTFPLANAATQDTASSVGRRAGFLYGANTLGAVLGALISGFWLLPVFGTQISVLVWLCCSMLSLAPLLIATRASLARPVALAGVGVVCAGVLLTWLRLPRDWLVTQSIPPDVTGKDVLTISEGIGETIIIVGAEGASTLITNGHAMSSTALGAQRYMRLFSHLPLLQAPQARDALVICFGVGNTLNSTLLHPQLERVDMVDISAHVLSHASYFRDVNGSPLEDRRVRVFVNDGRQHLRMMGSEQYDLITAEPPPISHAGVAALYSSEFYELVRSRLKPGGVMTHWLPIHQVPGAVGLSVVRAFLDVFPNAILLAGNHQHLILVGVNGSAPFQLDPVAVRAALASNEAVLEDLRRVGADTLVELAGLLVASPATLSDATRGVAPVTDDYPILEYHANRPLQGRSPIASTLFRPQADFETWCPRCTDPTLATALTDLPSYLSVVSKIYASDGFLRSTGAFEIMVDARQHQVIRNSQYLSSFFAEHSDRSPR